MHPTPTPPPATTGPSALDPAPARTIDPPPNPVLEAALAAVEGRLEGLGEALRARDATAIDTQADALHMALEAAVDSFLSVARAGHVPPPLRRRLAQASGQVAAQRESLARATAALDRAIEVLIPRAEPTLYSAYGNPQRAKRGGMIQA